MFNFNSPVKHIVVPCEFIKFCRILQLDNGTYLSFMLKLGYGSKALYILLKKQFYR